MKKVFLISLICLGFVFSVLFNFERSRAQDNSGIGQSLTSQLVDEVGKDGELFNFVGERREGGLAVASEASVREQSIEINFSTLTSLSSEQIFIPLFDGTLYKAIRAKDEGFELRGLNDYTWRGYIEGKMEWSVTISVKNLAVAGLIYAPSGVYEIIPQANLHAVLVELNQSHFLGCPSVGHLSSLSELASSADLDRPIRSERGAQTHLVPEDTGTQIDVLVVYTQAVRTALGGTPQAQAFVQQAVDTVNTAYLNSGINPRVRLVHSEEINYQESGDSGTDLNWMYTDPTISSLRSTYDADAVSLFVNALERGGIALSMEKSNFSYGFANRAISVVKRSEAVADLSFAHELAHNYGTEHNVENATTPQSQLVYPYAYGHRVDPGHRTIMSYPCGVFSDVCPRIAFYSTPNRSFGGQPLGIANQRDNARVINNTAYTVANFRDTSGCSYRAGQGAYADELTSFQYGYLTGGTFLLGCPTSLVLTNGFTSFQGTVGHYQSTAAGELEYHTNGPRAGQSFAVLTPFRNKWASFGFNDNNPLGYPIGFVSLASGSCDGTQNRYQSFEGGSLTQHLSGPLNSNVYEVHGAIHRRWELSGFAICPLGLPTSDETTAQPSGASGSTGKLNQFQGGQIYWKTAAPEAYEVHGSIYSTYVGTGGSASWLGFPTSNEYTSNGRARSDFEGGYITTLDGTNYQAFPNSGCPNSPTVNPLNGPVGTQVTISGNNFIGVSSLRFTNNVSASFTVNSGSQITASVPTGSVTGPITLIKTNCPSVQTNTFTVGTNPPPSDIQFSTAAYSISENSSPATITVTRSGGTGTVGINYVTSNGTATAGSDYSSTSGTLSFGSTDTSKTFTVSITDDAAVEGNETINLTLTNPTGGATLGSPSTSVLTIVDNDAACSYSFQPPSTNYASVGGTGSFNVITGVGCGWTATVNAPTFSEILSTLNDNSAKPLTELESPQNLFLNSTPISMSDRTSNTGPPGTAAPYPSEITVSGMTGTITGVDVVLNMVGHTYPDDIDVILVGPGGQKTLIMSDAGGSADVSGVNLTFNQSASSTLPDTTQISPGTYRPSNFAGDTTPEPNGIDVFPLLESGGALYPADLNIFNGTSPNGIWRLYVVDDFNVDNGSIAGGWALNITTASGSGNWVNLTSGSSGNGNGTVNYSVAANTGTNLRFVPIKVNGQDAHIVAQDGTSGGCLSNPISIGGTVNGSLSSSDCVLSGSKYYDSYQFSGSAGQQVAVSMNSTAFDTYLYLLGASNNILAQDNNSGPGTNSRIPGSSGYFTLPSNGTYTIQASSNLSNATGSYSVSISQCSFAFASTSNTLSPGEGGGTTRLNSLSGCAWTSTSDSPPWLTSNDSGVGTDNVSYDFLSNPTTSTRVGHIIAGGATYTVTQIGRGEAGSVQFGASLYTADEGSGVATITITRTSGLDGGFVWYTVTDGTATAGVDYLDDSAGYVFFSENELSESFNITVLDDAIFEGNETINVNITRVSTNGLTIGTPNWVPLTLIDNDSPTSISGTVTYGNAAVAPKFISNVMVTGTGSPNVFATTSAPGGTAGQYSLTGFGAGSYTVSLSKTTGQNSISSLDAAQIAAHVAGTATITSTNKMIAADTTGNGSISSQDAAFIARFAAGLGAPFGNTNQWRFFIPGPTFPIGASPTTRTYPSVASNIAGEDFIGILIGEVSGNWNPTAARSAAIGEKAVNSGPERGVAVELPQLSAAVGKEVFIPVKVQGAESKGIISYEFDLRYDPSIVQPVAEPVDLKGTASRGLSVVVNPTEPGLLRVVVYGPLPIDRDGVLLNLRFVAVGAAGSVSDLSFERIMFNEGEPQIRATTGQAELF